jgi:hypothetical protein
MLRFSVFFWLILTVVLLAYPIGFLVYFLGKDSFKYLFLIWNKFSSIKTLHKIKQEIIEHSIQEQRDVDDYVRPSSQENPFSDVSLSSEDSSCAVSETLDGLVDKEQAKKKKKMIEKVVYEALVFRKDGKLEEYEKKIIE